MALFAFVSCTQQTEISEGIWVEPVPSFENQVQGFSLEVNGKASSINMSTLKYEGWKTEGNNLILSGKSIGNKQTLPFSDTLYIKEYSDSKLVLQKGNSTLTYNKVNQQIYNKYVGTWNNENYPIVKIDLSSFDAYIIKEYYGDKNSDNKGLTYIAKEKDGILTAIAPDSVFYKYTKPSFKYENGDVIFTSGVGTVKLKKTTTPMPNVQFKKLD